MTSFRMTYQILQFTLLSPIFPRLDYFLQCLNIRILPVDNWGKWKDLWKCFLYWIHFPFSSSLSSTHSNVNFGLKFDTAPFHEGSSRFRTSLRDHDYNTVFTVQLHADMHMYAKQKDNSTAYRIRFVFDA